MEYPKIKYFHWFFGEMHGISEGERIDDKNVRIEFRNLHTEKIIVHHLLIDIREKRILVIYDGPYNFLPGSIPKAGDEIEKIWVGEIASRIENIRKRDLEAEGNPYAIKNSLQPQIVTVPIYRHFLLLPCGKAIVQRIHDKRSLSIVYSFVRVWRDESKNGYPRVEWINTNS
ncbi:MAG: hypothetical protein UV40_C0033G0008 [Parcubacteria group bacterium GW2011_GWA1_42_7]|nr:MAG: hypothetical protein UV34_C0036G0004 [Parcubacteria group bacterium GW2011_GWB1_42_6]KKS69121.1 MAG: hypothetical protein UV40_C0033G0008 [Parcubacteria group bacterium GW2011_GWA1_42_7]KKS92240.1 MAG: hypothetical protein UV67_C0007G0006 [Parcubacteria group bacterium GW2011_GWC1_43_12]